MPKLGGYLPYMSFYLTSVNGLQNKFSPLAVQETLDGKFLSSSSSRCAMPPLTADPVSGRHACRLLHFLPIALLPTAAC